MICLGKIMTVQNTYIVSEDAIEEFKENFIDADTCLEILSSIYIPAKGIFYVTLEEYDDIL